MEVKGVSASGVHEGKEHSRRQLLPLIAGDLILIIALSCITMAFYRSLEAEIYTERTAYLEEITGQIVSTTDSISNSQWDFATVFANHLRDKGPSKLKDLASHITWAQESFDQQGLSLLIFDEEGRYYDAEGHQARWNGSVAEISETAPERQVEITTLTTTTVAADEMVFVLKMDQSLLLKEEDILLTHVAVVRNMDIFSETFNVPSFQGKGENYIISSMGTRVYRGQGTNEVLGDIYNVLKPLEQSTFLFDGSYGEIKQAVVAGESCCLEYLDPAGQAYYVTSSPMSTNDWSLLSIVPVTVVSVGMQRFMNMTLLGMGAIALVLLAAVSLTLFFVVRYRAGQQLVEQQAQANEALRTAVQAAEEASRAKSVFLSHMSHDIRTPINGIMGMTDIAQRNREDPSRVEDCLGKIASSSQHLLSLVNDVLDMSRIESGKVEIESAPFSVDGLLDGCYSVVAGQALERKLNLHKDFSGIKQHYLRGDELHLRQIIINILGNSTKFTPEGGQIDFLAADRLIGTGESELTVVIRDNGIGMSEEFIKKIFEAFSQAEDAGRSQYKGTGLGMSIVKQLVDLMGGEIDVQSAPGAGSTFTVRLCLPVEEISVQEQSADSGVADLTGLRVLLVEDNELNMEIACYILEECNVEITAAENGQIALEQFMKQPANSFDVILMDVMMPVMDGLAATRAIRSSGKGDAESIPIVAMTANAYAEDRKTAIEAGMNEHLAKPIERDELVRILCELRAQKGVQ